MLTIRPEQLQAFESARLASFDGRVLAHLREHFWNAVAPWSDREAAKRIEGWRLRAEAEGLRSEQMIVCFIDLCVLLGEGFEQHDQHRDVVALLTDPATSDADRTRLAIDLAWRKARLAETTKVALDG